MLVADNELSYGLFYTVFGCFLIDANFSCLRTFFIVLSPLSCLSSVAILRHTRLLSFFLLIQIFLIRFL